MFGTELSTKTKMAFYGLGLVATFLLGGVTAIYTRPATVELKEKYTHVETQLQTVDNSKTVDINELMKQLKVVVAKTNVSVDKGKETTAPDGTVTREWEKSVDLSETNTRIDTQTETLSSVREQLKILNQKFTLDETIKERIVTNTVKTNHRAGALLGYNLGGLLGKHESYNLIPVRGVVLQLQFEKRLFGPLFWVLFAQSTGVAGAGLKAEF